MHITVEYEAHNPPRYSIKILNVFPLEQTTLTYGIGSPHHVSTKCFGDPNVVLAESVKDTHRLRNLKKNALCC